MDVLRIQFVSQQSSYLGTWFRTVRARLMAESDLLGFGEPGIWLCVKSNRVCKAIVLAMLASVQLLLQIPPRVSRLLGANACIQV